jgi:hypothetical protein
VFINFSYLKKYQFTIYTAKNRHANSASTKAVNDCTTLFSKFGYKNYNLLIAENTRVLFRYLTIAKKLWTFYNQLQNGSLVAIQYPMLNNVFPYFIKVARLKRVKFFCIIHDIESLRAGGQNKKLVKREIENLNYYNCLIVHNETMLKWLITQGITTAMIPLHVFDYLLKIEDEKSNNHLLAHSIVFAGNLEKSNFLYSLREIRTWNFNIYGPNFREKENTSLNVVWRGQYSPDKIVYNLEGNFGLIWDGDRIDRCDSALGNYLKYNNPHKFSLYLAAGLPVIAPRNSAIGKIITDLQIGILIDDLRDLDNLQVNEHYYKMLQKNCNEIRNKLISGQFFREAVEKAERQLTAQ